MSDEKVGFEPKPKVWGRIWQAFQAIFENGKPLFWIPLLVVFLVQVVVIGVGLVSALLGGVILKFGGESMFGMIVGWGIVVVGMIVLVVLVIVGGIVQAIVPIHNVFKVYKKEKVKLMESVKYSLKNVGRYFGVLWHVILYTAWPVFVLIAVLLLFAIVNASNIGSYANSFNLMEDVMAAEVPVNMIVPDAPPISAAGPTTSFQAGLEEVFNQEGPLLYVNYALGLIGLAAVILLVVISITRGPRAVFALYAALDKKQKGKPALQDSIKLVQGKWWQTVGNYFLFGLMVVVVAIVFSMASMSLLDLLPSAGFGEEASVLGFIALVLKFGVDMFFQAFVMVWGVVFTFLLYKRYQKS